MQRPPSAVSDGTGVAGLFAFFIATTVSITSDLSLPTLCFVLPASTAAVMIVWSLAVEKVHLRPSTGLDFALRRPFAALVPLVIPKVIGLGGTFLILAVAYMTFRTYQGPEYRAYLHLFFVAAIVILAVSPLYIFFVTRYMTDPKDGLWHFGRAISLAGDEIDHDKVKEYLLGWMVKGFFLAFMVSIFPGQIAWLLKVDWGAMGSSPVQTAVVLVRILFIVDVCFGTIGYILTLRILDSHIRSSNPFLAGWLAALACYPPFNLTATGGPLDYRTNGQEWTQWLAGADLLAAAWGLAIIGLAVVYAWATVAFGIRFSNLTNRGILTNGPYRFFKHPAYLSKNLMWWLTYMPFLSTASFEQAATNCVLLLFVNLLYLARARTEEAHLMNDPSYRRYASWIDQYGAIPRLLQFLRPGKRLTTAT